MQSTLSKTFLAYVISPIHVVSAVAALRKLHGKGGFSCLMVFSYPGAPASTRLAVLSVIEAMCAEVAEVTGVIETTDEWIDGVGDRGSAGAAAVVYEHFGKSNFDGMLYAHDVVGKLVGLLIENYPAAKTICYGDALGMVYQADVHLGLIKSAAPEAQCASTPVNLTSRLREFARRLLRGGAPESLLAEIPSAPSFQKSLRPELAVLALPIDQSGLFLDGVELTVVEKPVVLDAMRSCGMGAADFLRSVGELLADRAGGECCLLLTENNAEAGFISFERESDMYAAMVREVVKPGATVVIKSHPGEWLPRNAAIRERLEADYRVVEVDPRFARYPIELAETLVRSCAVVCMSFPTLSLKYLYDVNVRNPMDDEFVEAWFPRHLWDSYKNAQALYRIPLARLPDWDGASPLFSGG